MNKQYEFITEWQIRAPLKQVWHTIYESEKWPDWWKGVEDVKELIQGDEKGIGSVRSYTLSSPTGYKLTFHLLLTKRIEHKLLEGTASGELEGTGSWHFKEKDSITTVTCVWQVATTKAWMNYLGFLLDPLFRLNHSTVMKWGAKSLAQKLAAELISY